MTNLGLLLLVIAVALAAACAFLLLMVRDYRIELRDVQAQRDDLLAALGDAEDRQHASTYWTAFDRERGRWAADPELES